MNLNELSFLKDLSNRVTVSFCNEYENGDFEINYATRNRKAIEFFNKTIEIKNDDEYYNITLNRVEKFGDKDASTITVPSLPYEIAPPAILLSSQDEKFDDNSFFMFQKKMYDFVKDNKHRIITTRIPKDISLKLSFIYSFYNLENKVFFDEDDYKYSFLSLEIANDKINLFYSVLSQWLSEISPGLPEELDAFSKLKEYYIVEINKAVEQRIKTLDQYKKSHIQQAIDEGLDILVDDIRTEYENKKTRLKKLTIYSYRKMLDSFDDVFELLRFYPNWLNAPGAISKDIFADSFSVKIYLTLRTVGSNITLHEITNEYSEARINQESKEGLKRVINNRKNEILKELEDFEKENGVIEEVSSLRNKIFAVNEDPVVDNMNHFTEVFKYEWPEILAPEPKNLIIAKNIISDSSEIFYHDE